MNIPKIPTHTRQITPSGRVGAVEMPYDIARTGEGIIGAGLQQAGGALFELGLRKQQIRVDREFTQGKLLLAKADRESLEELRRDSTFRNVKADYVYVDQAGRQIKGIPGYFQNWIREKSRTRADIIEKIASSNQSKDALNEYLAFSEESFRSDANRMAWMKEKDYSRSSAFTAADEFERMGNATAAETLIRRAMENEYVGLEEGEKRIGLIKHNIDWYAGEAMANGSPKEFLDKINNKNFLPNLNPSEKLRLSKQAEKGNIEQQESDRALINKTLFVDKNYDIFNLVSASSLDEKEKLSFYKLARTLDAAPPEGYKDNPVLMAKILPLVAKGALTETEIRDYVGKGLSPETAESIIKGELFWRDYWFKESDDFLKRNLGWSSRDDMFMHPLGSVAYDAALRELRTIVLEERLKGREIMERAREIGLPYLTDYWKEIIGSSEAEILKMTEMVRGKKIAGLPVKKEPKLKPSTTLDDIWGK